jgi:hypothetical protein
VQANLYTFVGIYSRGLDTLNNLLTKGAAHAAGLGVTEGEMLEWRLAEDMFPVRRQAQIVLSFATQWPARAAGLEIPAGLEGEPSLAELQAAIVKAKAYLAALTPEQLAGRDATPLTYNVGGQMEPTLPTAQWISNFATTNFYFHLSMAYAILRMKGAPLGKVDMFGGGL